MKLIKIIFAVIIITLTTNCYAQSFTVIVNNSVNVSSIEKSELQKMFLGKVELWNNNIKIVPCYIHPNKSEAGKNFFDQVLEMDLEKFNRTWLKKVFSGYGIKPNEFSDDNAVIEFVTRTNGAVGFISNAGKVKEGNCKVVKMN